MRTLNEQIQRLRDVLVTCYNAIKRKGGTIPEVGERNMTNLPAAVLSIPQEHTELTELMVTTNGEYFPADHDADGFSKVTVDFDTSSLGRVQVESLKISDTCIYNGVWKNGSLIDFSKAISMQNVFRKCITLEQMEVNGWNINENPISFASMFQDCSSLKRLDFSKSNKVKPTSMNLCFGSCSSLNTIIGLDKFDTSLCTDFTQTFYLVPALECDITSWDFSNAVSTGSMFLWSGINTIVGGRDLDTIIRDNICAFNNVTCNVSLFNYNSSPPLDIASLRAIINGLADVNHKPAESRPTLNLGTTLMAKLTEEDIAIAADKGWNLQ